MTETLEIWTFLPKNASIIEFFMDSNIKGGLNWKELNDDQCAPNFVCDRQYEMLEIPRNLFSEL